ncbi:MAG TPA: hypothetical protein DDY91_13570 [Planctomycetaceae bacterium]|jgi:hypothetical protein|nr:hypothetical protein [Planctomycetaceae bacterium]
MSPLRVRFLLAAGAIVLGGVAIMLIQKGVGDHPVLKGGIVCAMGVILALTGLLRPETAEEPDPRPRLFQPEGSETDD